MPTLNRGQLNRLHPLSTGLVFYATPSGHQRTDLVRDQQAILLPGTSPVNTPYGEGLQSTSSTNGGLYWTWNSTLASIVRNHTLMIFVKFTTVQQNGRIICVPANSGFTTPFHSLNFGFDNTAGTPNITWGYQRDATNASNVVADAGMYNPADGYVALWVTREGATVKFWKNDKQYGASKNLGANNFDIVWGNQPLAVMNRSGTNPGLATQGNIVMVAGWNRALQPSEILSTYNDMSEVVRPKRYYLPPDTDFTTEGMTLAAESGSGVIQGNIVLSGGAVTFAAEVGTGVIQPGAAALTISGLTLAAEPGGGMVIRGGTVFSTTGITFEAQAGGGVITSAITLTSAGFTHTIEPGAGSIITTSQLSTTGVTLAAEPGNNLIVPGGTTLALSGITQTATLGGGLIQSAVALTSSGVTLEAQPGGGVVASGNRTLATSGVTFAAEPGQGLLYVEGVGEIFYTQGVTLAAEPGGGRVARTEVERVTVRVLSARAKTRAI